MQMSEGFNLGALLRDAAGDLKEDRIEYLPFEKIHQDPNNFYSLEGLNELADNISLFGLMDPLRVRPDGSGSYTVTSGHRRRAAIKMLIDGGEDRWKDRTPCIVDHGECTPEFQELKLIFANSSTRIKTSAEMSREAERVTELLYSLQEQGYEFPGRMRDHVAAACGVTKSKIARLHAIRENLVAGLLRFYDSGEMSEDAAYRLSRFPKDIQTALAEKLSDGRKHAMPTGSVVETVFANLDSLQKPIPCRAHAGGPECHNANGRIVYSLTQQATWRVCDSGKCCMDCYLAKQGCAGACKEAKDRAKLEEACEKEKAEEAEKRREAEQQTLKRRIQKRSKEILKYIDASGLPDDKRISSDYQAAKASDIRKWAAGDMEGLTFYSENCVKPQFTRDAIDMANRLGCSVEFAMGVKESKTVDPDDDQDPWHDGTPDKQGWYVVQMIFLGKPLSAPRCFYWNSEAWVLDDGVSQRPIDRACEVVSWYPVPWGV